MSKKVINSLRNANKQIVMFTINDKEKLRAMCEEPVNIITDYPTLGACDSAE